MPKLTTNNLIKQVDLPVWEWTKNAPLASAAGTASCAARNSNYNLQHGRYVYYYFNATNFWRYDTWTDGWQQLANPSTVTLSTSAAMEFMPEYGPEGKVLGAGSNTIQTQYFTNNSPIGYEIRIVAGTGAGQRRVITGIKNEPHKWPTYNIGLVQNNVGSMTMSALQSIPTDNSLLGRTFFIQSGPGAGQQRLVLGAVSGFVLSYSATNFEYNLLHNPSVFQTVPVANSSIASIRHSELTVDTNWDIQPDSTSVYRICSGLVALSTLSTTAIALTYYDILTDCWYYGCTGTVNAASASDIGVDFPTELATVIKNSVATSSGTTTTLNDSNSNWTTNSLVNKYVYIYSGSGRGNVRKIVSNTATSITWTDDIGTATDSTTRYTIDLLDCGKATSATSTSITDTGQSFEVNRYKNFRLFIVSGTGMGQSERIVSNTSNQITISRNFQITPDNTSVYIIRPDNNYLFFSTGANHAIPKYHIPTGIFCFGNVDDYGYNVGACGVTSGLYGRVLPISSATKSGTTMQVNFTIPCLLKTGDSVTIYGDTSVDAATHNGTFIVDSLVNEASIRVTTSNSGGAFTITGYGTTTLKDPIKNFPTYTSNTKIATIHSVGTTTNTYTYSASLISSNNSTTLTLNGLTITPAATTRYLITDGIILGISYLRSSVNGSSIDDLIPTFTFASGTHTTTTIATNMTFSSFELTGKRIKFIAGTNYLSEAIITTNTANLITVSAAITTPVSSSTAFAICDTNLKGVGTHLEFIGNHPNNNFCGRHLYCPRAGGFIGFEVIDIRYGYTDYISKQSTPALTTGSMYAYDGYSKIYITDAATMRIWSYDLSTGDFTPCSQIPYVTGTAILGNKLDIFETKDGLLFLLLNRHSNIEMFRTLLF